MREGPWKTYSRIAGGPVTASQLAFAIDAVDFARLADDIFSEDFLVNLADVDVAGTESSREDLFWQNWQ